MAKLDGSGGNVGWGETRAEVVPILKQEASVQIRNCDQPSRTTSKSGENRSFRQNQREYCRNWNKTGNNRVFKIVWEHWKASGKSVITEDPVELDWKLSWGETHDRVWNFKTLDKQGWNTSRYGENVCSTPLFQSGQDPILGNRLHYICAWF